MNINIETANGPVVVNADAVVATSTPKGNWWRIQYRVDGEVVYAASSRLLPHGHVPGPLEALDWSRKIKRGDEEISGTNMDHLVEALEVIGY